MDSELLKFLYIENNKPPQSFFDDIQSLIVILGDPDSILVFRGEAEIGWYRSDPDRMLEITVYEDDEMDLWFSKTTFINDEEVNICGEVGSSLQSLRDWLEYGE